MWPSAYRLCRRRIARVGLACAGDGADPSVSELRERSFAGRSFSGRSLGRSLGGLFRTIIAGQPSPPRRAMISDPKLPFDSAPTGVETRVGSSTASSRRRCIGKCRTPTVGPNEQQPSVVPPCPFQQREVWLRRVGVLLFVFLCATLGVMLMIVPWRPGVIDNRCTVLAYPDAARTGKPAVSCAAWSVSSCILMCGWGYWRHYNAEDE